MSTDKQLASLTRRDWLTNGPLNGITARYIEVLRAQHYAESTMTIYLGCLAHFSYWMKAEGLDLSNIAPALIERFLQSHLPVCTCPTPRRSTVTDVRAALRHLRNLLPQENRATAAEYPIAAELSRFSDYLLNICGVAPLTYAYRIKHVGAFLIDQFGTQTPLISQLVAADIDNFLIKLHWKPSSLRVVCTSLRSYFRFHALLGESTQVLSASLPRIADWRHATLPKALSDAQLDVFLKAFDCSDPVGLRDYAIARCLVDLGLRGDEVAHLALESVGWQSGTLTIHGNKGRRAQQLPLPVHTGEAIVRYLRQGRPQTVNRALFVRHRAPIDKPLSVAAIRNAMNRAFARCGLGEQFCNTHVLRHTMATRLQKSGASVKEIADLLRHQSLDTASTYARVDLEGLRTVALPWPGSRP